ncbi:MAG TPA: hypothetical protein VG713_21455 [Pirellulales bacterium]|nr:hypothetical protein [Pirellulales bacterium]
MNRLLFGLSFLTAVVISSYATVSVAAAEASPQVGAPRVSAIPVQYWFRRSYRRYSFQPSPAPAAPSYSNPSSGSSSGRNYRSAPLWRADQKALGKY